MTTLGRSRPTCTFRGAGAFTDRFGRPTTIPAIFVETLRSEIRAEYTEVATVPGKGFHFHRSPVGAVAGLPRQVAEWAA